MHTFTYTIFTEQDNSDTYACKYIIGSLCNKWSTLSLLSSRTVCKHEVKNKRYPMSSSNRRRQCTTVMFVHSRFSRTSSYTARTEPITKWRSNLRVDNAQLLEKTRGTLGCYKYHSRTGSYCKTTPG